MRCGVVHPELGRCLGSASWYHTYLGMWICTDHWFELRDEAERRMRESKCRR